MVDPTEFTSHTNINWNGHVGTVEYGGGDKGQVVMFYNRPVVDSAASQAAGCPKYKDVPFVRIHPPGERNNIVDKPATGEHARRWPAQWRQFIEGKQQEIEGTPIDLLYPDQPSVGATLRANGVYTIDQCAELSGPAIDNIGMGAQHWSNAAKKYMQAANRGVKASQMLHELDARDREIHTLKRQVEEMKGIIQNLQAANAVAPSLEQIQAAIAGASLRPQYPQQARQHAFDPAVSMINAAGAAARPSRQPKKSRTRL
jgi:hypothetical protein